MQLNVTCAEWKSSDSSLTPQQKTMLFAADVKRSSLDITEVEPHSPPIRLGSQTE
jgi:hypothetical protein